MLDNSFNERRNASDIVLRMNADQTFVVLKGHRRYSAVMAQIRRHRPWYQRLWNWFIYR